MKQPLALKILVDPKDVRRAVAMLIGESLTDEELEEKFYSCEPVELDLTEADPKNAFSMNAALVLLMMEKNKEYEGRI